ncbi:NADPH:quinone reductase [Bosea sp. (in: a-proteobacteria)]|uniref:NADPH:quinone reductase n=1 Tax=Bosea sp. (in: a-proteobacteria) TaxID=1871050 RepID=UPI00261740CC|nr:NADPH:quinone reductase [Bosea sp. (in: a-proteobacteria)]MCO5093126.1 NADPH:quinone reductase [Bosea sp. (in: a-proteobacteria)]
MKAAWYERNGPAREVMIVGEMAIPEPGPNQVLVRVHASGANPHDVKARSGWTGNPLYAEKVVPHADGAGFIEKVGPGVPASRLGQRVWTFRADAARPGGGTAAEFAVVNAAHAVPLPDNVPLSTGASLGVPAITAHTAVLRDGTVAGQWVLVHAGAGAVGQFAIQFARWSGARVIASASTPEKAGIARACGADEVLDYRDPDFVAKVRDLTGGLGVDRIVEVDLGENLAADIGAIRMNGIIASYSSTRVPKPVVDYYAVAAKGVTLHTVQGRHLSEERRAAAVRDISALLSRDLLKAPEPAIFAFDDVAAAHEMIEAGAGIRKVMLAVRSLDA